MDNHLCRSILDGWMCVVGLGGVGSTDFMVGILEHCHWNNSLECWHLSCDHVDGLID